MPRQDVPYGGAICRLRERIAEIFDKLGEKLHTINGVPGDGDGNVKIVSGSSAVVINNDPTQNEIEVSLDTSQLPAASVSSVNGQTGAVALDAGDIPTVGGDVQADLQDLANDISGNTAAINAEALARQGADSTLQTNINAVLASIPDMSVTPDPYKGVERDAQGRAFAADPASGATDKTLTTANWISQTGDSGPNNLLHKSGNETAAGNKTFTGQILAQNTIRLTPTSNIRRGIVTRLTNSSTELYFIGNSSDTGPLYLSHVPSNIALLQADTNRLWTGTKPSDNSSALRNIIILTSVPTGGQDGDLAIVVNNGIYRRTSGTWSKIL